jgi:4-amino-4-deoxychorismate lyase
MRTPDSTTPGNPPLDPIIYADGELVPLSAAHVPFESAGALYGVGFFETFRTSGGRPHHVRFHRARVTQACVTAGIELPADFLLGNEARLREVVSTLLRENAMSGAVFRYTIAAGTPASKADRSFSPPAEFLTVRALPPAAPSEGISLRVLKLARDNGEWLPRPKSLNYLNAFVGAEELRRRSTVASDEGLFLAREGSWVVETPRQNLAWIAGGKWFHPDLNLGAVAGTCLAWATEIGIEFTPRRAALDELRAADAVIVLNAVRGITPVRELWDQNDRNRLQVYSSSEHPSVLELQQQWNEALVATARKE